MENTICINPSTCKKCFRCAEVCPNKIPVRSDHNEIAIRANRINLCFQCGQCMAVCPSKSIIVDGFSYERDFFDLPSEDPGNYERTFYNMIYTRRAIRNFQDKPIPEEMLKKVVNALSFAPPGFPPLKTEIIVIDNADLIRKGLPNMIRLYEKLIGMMRKPLFRYFIKKEIGSGKFRTMKEHLVPLLKGRMDTLKDGTEDTITRNAPAMILFIADKNGEDIRQDIAIAATYGMLAAHALGLGGSIMDLIPPAIEKDPELRKLYCIPEDKTVMASLILGYPKFRYQRGIRRNLKSVKWL